MRFQTRRYLLLPLIPGPSIVVDDRSLVEHRIFARPKRIPLNGLGVQAARGGFTPRGLINFITGCGNVQLTGSNVGSDGYTVRNAYQMKQLESAIAAAAEGRTEGWAPPSSSIVRRLGGVLNVLGPSFASDVVINQRSDVVWRIVTDVERWYWRPGLFVLNGFDPSRAAVGTDLGEGWQITEWEPMNSFGIGVEDLTAERFTLRSVGQRTELRYWRKFNALALTGLLGCRSMVAKSAEALKERCEESR